MFHSLLTTFDYGGKRRSLPQLEIYRRQIQLFYRALEAGDRRILSKKVEIATETIDGRGNLINATSPVINQEIEAGMQTSANRLITQPSAMSDARIGSEYDDAKTAAMMERIRRVMNVLIIPRITPGKVEFRWGKQDNFEFGFGQLLQAKSAGFVSAEEERVILKSVGWRLDDQLFSAQNQQLQKQENQRFLDEELGQLLAEHNDFLDSSGRSR